MEQPKTDVIYAWGMVSDHQATTYETILRADGTLECDCPGWIFKRPNKPRNCKHVERVRGEAQSILGGATPIGTIQPVVDPIQVPQKAKKIVRKGDPVLQQVRRRMINLDDAAEA